jgi:hypothetical protein
MDTRGVDPSLGRFPPRVDQGGTIFFFQNHKNDLSPSSNCTCIGEKKRQNFFSSLRSDFNKYAASRKFEMDTRGVNPSLGRFPPRVGQGGTILQIAHILVKKSANFFSIATLGFQ